MQARSLPHIPGMAAASPRRIVLGNSLTSSPGCGPYLPETAYKRRSALLQASGAAQPCSQRRSQQCGAAAPLLMGETAKHELSREERHVLAESLGYRTVGAQLPGNVTLSKVVSTLPKDVSPWHEVQRLLMCKTASQPRRRHSSRKERSYADAARASCCDIRS